MAFGSISTGVLIALLVAGGAIIGFVVAILALARVAERERRESLSRLRRMGIEIRSESPLEALGPHAGGELRIDTETTVSPRTTFHHTVIRLSGAGSPPETVVQRNHRGLADPPPPTHLRPVSTGNASFDERFQAYALDEEGERLWKDPARRSRMMDLGKTSRFGEVVRVETHPEEGASLRLEGADLRVATLDRALDLVTDLAQDAPGSTREK